MDGLFYAVGDFDSDFTQGSFATAYVGYVLGRADGAPFDFTGGTGRAYGTQAQKFFAFGYASLGDHGSAFFSSDPFGAFEDFAIFPETGTDPINGYVIADNSGTVTGVGSNPWTRHWRAVVPPRKARFVVPHVRLGSVPAGGVQYFDAHQVEVLRTNQAAPQAFDHARAIHVNVRPTRMNYATGSLHITMLTPGTTYIASADVNGKRESYTFVATGTTADLVFSGPATKILVEEGTTLRDYFDGNSGADYLWEQGGVAGSTRSYYYPDRLMRHAVLVRNLAENVALGMTVETPQYAIFPVADSTD